MSADNGVYIGRFVKDGVYSYRVIHAQAIENCDQNDDFPEELRNSYIARYYGQAKEIFSKDKAFEAAKKIYDEIMESNFPIVEYGIQEIHYDIPFPRMTREEAAKYQNNFWGTKGRL